MNQNRFDVVDEKITYLCSWSKILNRDRNRFKNHLRNGLGFILEKFEIYQNQNNVNEIFGRFVDNDGEKYDFTLMLHESNMYVSLHLQGKLLYANQNFTIRSKDDEYLLYIRKDSFRTSKKSTLSKALNIKE